jgi:hypothetical protein
MPLTDEKRKNLRELIQTTFTEQQLKDTCTENEQRLEGNLYDLVEGTTYKSKLINLVRYLDQKNLINTFLTILGNENQNFAAQMQSFITQENTSDPQNTNNIVSYLFFIIEPKTNKEFFIKAEFVQFANNNRQEELNRFYIELNGEEESKIYLENEIPNYIDKIIIKLQTMITLPSLPIIELFLPVNILSKDFDIKKITNEWGKQRPIGELYPLTVRSYERNFKNNRLQTLWSEKWQDFQAIQNNKDLIINAKQINSPLPTSSQERERFFQEILSNGFPLCLWTRYKSIDDISMSANFICILNIDSNSPHNFCKFYRIHRNIHNIRIRYMSHKKDFGYNLGVLFDHDKIPTGANQLISPNMAKKV